MFPFTYSSFLCDKNKLEYVPSYMHYRFKFHYIKKKHKCFPLYSTAGTAGRKEIENRLYQETVRCQKEESADSTGSVVGM